jgi:hypothetical protein
MSSSPPTAGRDPAGERRKAHALDEQDHDHGSALGSPHLRGGLRRGRRWQRRRRGRRGPGDGCRGHDVQGDGLRDDELRGDGLRARRGGAGRRQDRRGRLLGRRRRGLCDRALPPGRHAGRHLRQRRHHERDVRRAPVRRRGARDLRGDPARRRDRGRRLHGRDGRRRARLRGRAARPHRRARQLVQRRRAPDDRLRVRRRRARPGPPARREDRPGGLRRRRQRGLRGGAPPAQRIARRVVRRGRQADRHLRRRGPRELRGAPGSMGASSWAARRRPPASAPTTSPCSG